MASNGSKHKNKLKIYFLGNCISGTSVRREKLRIMQNEPDSIQTAPNSRPIYLSP